MYRSPLKCIKVTVARSARTFNLYHFILNCYLIQSGDTPSYLKFSNISWIDWTGTTTGSTVAKIACSSNAPCDDLTFTSFNVSVPAGDTAAYVCSNAVDVSGAPGCWFYCTSTGASVAWASTCQAVSDSDPMWHLGYIEKKIIWDSGASTWSVLNCCVASIV